MRESRERGLFEGREGEGERKRTGRDRKKNRHRERLEQRDHGGERRMPGYPAGLPRSGEEDVGLGADSPLFSYPWDHNWLMPVGPLSSHSSASPRSAVQTRTQLTRSHRRDQRANPVLPAAARV